MAATVAVDSVPVLHFGRFPSVSNRPQRDAEGRLWRIIKIEAPHCWAASYGSDASYGKYRISVVRRSGHYRLPLATVEQRRMYKKMRRCGVDRDDALAALSGTV